MKKIIYLLLAIGSVSIYSCSNADQTANDSMAGIYTRDLTKITDTAQDTLMQENTVSNQAKIYSDKHVIYAGMNQDSTTYFGVGSYTMSNGIVSETMFCYPGIKDTSAIFSASITLLDNGFSQSIDYKGTQWGDVTGTEYYTKWEDGENGGLTNGLYKASEHIWIMNGDTMVTDWSDYKLMQNGHFIYAVTGTNLVSGAETSLAGSGKFRIEGNQLIEQEKHFLSGEWGPEMTVDIMDITENSFVQHFNRETAGEHIITYELVK